MNRSFLAIIVVAGLTFLYIPAQAQITNEERGQALQTAQEIAALMTNLEEQAADYPEVMDRLAQGLLTLEQADQTVADLIQRLTDVTEAMNDDQPFALSIGDYIGKTIDLIARADASDNEAIRQMSDDLSTTLEGLKQDDADRRTTVVDARNVIAALSENREALAFAIEAGLVEQMAELIAAEVEEYHDIVARGQAIADSLIDAATP